jgi:hypothetical protein
VIAPLTLLDYVLEGIDEPDIVWARSDAVLAAYASVGVHHYDSIRPLPGGLHRAVGKTDGVLAVIAQAGKKGLDYVGVAALFNNLDPGAKDAQRDVVFGLAGDTARVATDASAHIDEKAVANFRPNSRHQNLLFLRAFDNAFYALQIQGLLETCKEIHMAGRLPRAVKVPGSGQEDLNLGPQTLDNWSRIETRQTRHLGFHDDHIDGLVDDTGYALIGG